MSLGYGMIYNIVTRLFFVRKRGTKTGGRKNGEKTNRFGTEPIYGIPDGGGGK